MCGYYFGFVVLLVAEKGLQLRFCGERKLDMCFGIDGVFECDESVWTSLRMWIGLFGCFIYC